MSIVNDKSSSWKAYTYDIKQECFTEGTKLTCFSFPLHLPLFFFHSTQPTHTAIRITPNTTDEGKFEGQKFQRLCSVSGYVYIQTVTYSDTLTHILNVVYGNFQDILVLGAIVL